MVYRADHPARGVKLARRFTTFTHTGINGRWRDMLPAALSEAYEAKATSELGALSRVDLTSVDDLAQMLVVGHGKSNRS
jgi:hypothetical protein